MCKRLAAILLAVMIILSVAPGAWATTSTSIGFARVGGYSSGDPAFALYVDDAVMVYNNDSWYDPDYSEIYPSSKLYIPIYCTDDTGSSYYDDLANMSQISTNRVTASYTADPDEHVKRVSIQDGATAGSDRVDSGVAYAVVEFSDKTADANATAITLQLVLNVNKITEQDTRAWMRGKIINRTEELKSNSVYSAQIPTAFRSKVYSGNVTFDFGDGVRYTGQVKRNGYYLMSLNRDKNTSLTEQFKKVHMEFYQFEGGHKTFESMGELKIPVKVDDFRPKKKDDPQIYVYEMQGTSLTALDEKQLSYQSSNDTITIRTSRLGAYVLSAQPLTREVESDKAILYTGYADDKNDEPKTAKTGTPSSAPSPSPEISLENPSSGGDVVYAANSSTDNPSTSDMMPMCLFPVMLLLVSFAPYLWKKAFREG